MKSYININSTSTKRNMFHQEVYFIEKMIRLNYAYVIDIPEKGSFVCMSNLDKPNQVKINPIPHPEIDNYKKNNTDFVIWIPDQEKGAVSPYGQGLPSANLYVLGMYRS